MKRVAGPLLVAAACWCAAGTLAVASAADVSHRIAAVPPWWVFPLALVLAFAVPAWRDHPWTTAPAVLSILPWLPVPMTPVLLMWSGPLAWAPIVAALALAVGLAPLKWLGSWFNLLTEADDATVAALVLTLAVGGLSSWATIDRLAGGDEPHYLMITSSLLNDHDLDLDNNHELRQYESFTRVPLPRPDLRRRGLHGEGYSIHAPGTSVLVAPMFEFFGYLGARVTILLLTAIAGMLTWRLAWRATNDLGASWFAWAAVILTPTFAMHAYAVFPDGPGMFIVAAATLLLVQLARGDVPGPLPVVLTGLGLAALPWLHTRFALLAAGFGIALLPRLLTMDATRRVRAWRIVALYAAPVVSAALWLYFFKVLYGTFDPRAPYPPEPQQLSWIGPAILGLFFDGQYGLAAYAPAAAVAWLGWCLRPGWTGRRLMIEVAAIPLVYLAAVTTIRMWWAGLPSSPARFLVALLPMLAVPLAVAWSRVTVATRALFAALAGVGAVITTVLVAKDQAALLFNYRTAQPLWLEWLSPVVNLSRAWPAFFWQEPKFPLHVAIVLALGAALWLAIRTRGWAPRQSVAIWAAAFVMVAAPVGWAFTGARVVDPARAQMAVAARASAGGAVVGIGPARLGRLDATLGGDVLVHAEEPPADATPPLLALPVIAPGEYRLQVRSSGTFPAGVRVLLNRAPWRTFAIAGAGVHEFDLTMPATLSSFVVDAEDPKARHLLAAQLRLVRVQPAIGANVRSAAHYEAGDVLFLDGNVHAEPSGFWVRGKMAAEFVAAPDAPGATVTLQLRNGARANQVSVESGGFQRLLVFAPGETQTIDVPLDRQHRARIRVASGEGFVPAEEEPGSTDERFLGIWVQMVR